MGDTTCTTHPQVSAYYPWPGYGPQRGSRLEVCYSDNGSEGGDAQDWEFQVISGKLTRFQYEYGSGCKGTVTDVSSYADVPAGECDFVQKYTCGVDDHGVCKN